LPVWHSSNEHKNWYPAEGFRKVYFKQGRNKVLLRLENGHLGLDFSLYMHLGDLPPGAGSFHFPGTCTRYGVWF